MKIDAVVVVSLAFSIAASPIATISAAAGNDVIAQCACGERLSAGDAVIGKVVSVKGDVLMTRVSGFDIAESGAPLSVGTHMIVGPQSAASIVVGQSCALDLMANSDVEIRAEDGNLCVRIADKPSTAAIGGPPTVSGPVIVLGAGALAVGVGMALSASN